MRKSTVRSFIAIEITGEARSSLGRLINYLKQSHIYGLRTVDPETIHLTLKFLGEIPMHQVDHIAREISNSVEAQNQFHMELGNPGLFPSRENPRVLWIGLRKNLHTLKKLHEGINVQLAKSGYMSDTHKFRPHLTIARLKTSSDEAERVLRTEKLLSTVYNLGIRVNIEAVSLMRSVLHAKGATYYRIALIYLTGAANKYKVRPCWD